VNDELIRLLDSGLDITFSLASGHDAGRYDCFVIEADGDTIVGSGDTPAEALAAASPLEAAGGMDLAVVTAERGEHPGDVEAAAGLLPWVMAADGSTWRAQLPDGRTAVIERLDGAHTCACSHHAAEHSNIESGECLADGCGCVRLAEFGPSFLPRVYESRTDFAVGPVCAGVVGAAAWCSEFAARAPLAGPCAGGDPGHEPCSVPFLCGCACHAGQLEQLADAQ
jgi:hypothetical protein